MEPSPNFEYYKCPFCKFRVKKWITKHQRHTNCFTKMEGHIMGQHYKEWSDRYALLKADDYERTRQIDNIIEVGYTRWMKREVKR